MVVMSINNFLEFFPLWYWIVLAILVGSLVVVEVVIYWKEKQTRKKLEPAATVVGEPEAVDKAEVETGRQDQ